MQTRVLLAALAVVCCRLNGRAENWPQWRGPFFNGSTTETNLPSQWSKTTNVLWSLPLPGYSGATPIVWGESVFVSSPDPDHNLQLLCIEQGAVKWQRTVATGDRDKGRNNMASPSPVTDGRSVIILFATGNLAAFDFAGKELWKRDLGKDYGRFANMWIYGASPTLYGGRLYVQVLQRSPVPSDYRHAQDASSERESYLLCLDPETGQTLWRQARSTDAVEESMEAYSTPIPCKGAAGAEILVVGANFLTAHNPETGAEIWRCGALNERGQRSWRIVPSPVFIDGLVIACAPKRDPVIAVKDGGKGLVTETHLAWKFKEYPSDCVTPLAYGGKLYVLDGDRQMMTCLEPRTGEKKWQGRLGVREIFRASPTGAAGKIYCISENGTVVVLAAGDEFKIISTLPMGESPVRSSVAVANGKIFIRTAQNLYCIGSR